jgi:tetratricopeptide (TPR) repeat protein
VERHSTPLAEATTSSLEALKAYSNGAKAALVSGNEAAIPFYRRAIEIDPKFALAYGSLGLSQSSIGESELAAESTTRAWQLRDRCSERERFFIDFSYDRHVTGNLEKAYQTLELWAQTYPRGGGGGGGVLPSPHGLLGGLASNGTGRYETAIRAQQQAIADDPDRGLAYGALASTYLRVNRFSEAEGTLQRASERKLEVPFGLVTRYTLAVLKDNQQDMDLTISLARGKRRAEHLLAHAEALALARSGRLQAARRSSRRAVDLVLQEGSHEEAARYRAARAVWDALCGNAAEGKTSAMAALELSRGRDVKYAAGLALGLLGDYSRSEALAGELDRRFPEDTFVRFTYVPVLRALAALKRGAPAESVDRLEIARRYELAVNGLSFNGYYLGGLHSAYLRGEALTASRRYAEAVAEFQKLLDHRGLVASDPIGVLAHLQLGRAFVLSGDIIKAKAAYEAFFALWKDADPNVPILKSAKAEFARLSPSL